MLITRLKFNGPVLGFDYSLYQPDGANYTFRALSFVSNNQMDAANRVSEWYAIHGYKHNIINPATLLPENNPVWYLSAPRVLYPLLSAPFVAAIGIPGMLVIPSLALLGLMWIHHEIGRLFGRPELSLLFNIAIASSVTVSRWFIANLTDGLLAFLVGLIILVEIRVRKQWVWITLVIIIVTFSSATRFSVPIFLSLSVGYFILREVTKAMAILISGICGGIPLLFFQATSAVLPAGSSTSFLAKLIDLPLQSLKVIVVEIAELIVLDRVFIILILFSLFCGYQLRGKVGLLTYFVLIGVLTIGFINGTLGVNFRYQLPLIPFMGWCSINYMRLILAPTVR